MKEKVGHVPPVRVVRVGMMMIIIIISDLSTSTQRRNKNLTCIEFGDDGVAGRWRRLATFSVTSKIRTF